MRNAVLLVLALLFVTAFFAVPGIAKGSTVQKKGLREATKEVRSFYRAIEEWKAAQMYAKHVRDPIMAHEVQQMRKRTMREIANRFALAVQARLQVIEMAVNQSALPAEVKMRIMEQIRTALRNMNRTCMRLESINDSANETEIMLRLQEANRVWVRLRAQINQQGAEAAYIKVERALNRTMAVQNRIAQILDKLEAEGIPCEDARQTIGMIQERIQTVQQDSERLRLCAEQGECENITEKAKEIQNQFREIKALMRQIRVQIHTCATQTG